jgi:hypothetical protein
LPFCFGVGAQGVVIFQHIYSCRGW